MRLDDKQLLSSLARLRENPDFQRFMKQYIAGLLDEQISLCIERDEPARAQGAAKVLQEIQKDIEGAEEAYMRLTQTREVPLS